MTQISSDQPSNMIFEENKASTANDVVFDPKVKKAQLTEYQLEYIEDITSECEIAPDDGSNDYQIMWVDKKIVNQENQIYVHSLKELNYVNFK